MTENNACESQFVCSFVNSTVQQCGLIEYKKTWPSRILPLTCCKDSVDSHLYKYSISRRSIDSESSLLKIRAGLFEEDDDTLTICPKHRGVFKMQKRTFSKAYSSMSSWGTQRQILSLLVQDYSYNQLKDYIPDLSRYKFSAARKHAEVVGVGKPVLQKKQFREKATIQQIENFLEFILSPAIMTDSPFGECTYKISSGITLKVPKIILNSVRTRTVTLYLKYCEETQNADILSERTYMRLLEAIEPNVRKSMKGLDNFAADGSQAFDNLKSVVMTLGKGGKGQEWAEKIRHQNIQYHSLFLYMYFEY
ncbi:unnamed protein product [Mytilus edulis]|uniref:Uncharacterized protein n=1 Tax=Mytilus edulis TaxID=6550 RepID=A0A8S3V5W4_MYTED|nr:unnamed protein product [Mytilus edulis]